MKKKKIEAKKVSNDQIAAVIDNWILNQRNREIVKRNVIDGIHYESLAEEFGLCRTTIYTIVSEGIETILEHL